MKRNTVHLLLDMYLGGSEGSVLPLSPAARDMSTLAVNSGAPCLLGTPRATGHALLASKS